MQCVDASWVPRLGPTPLTGQPTVSVTRFHSPVCHHVPLASVPPSPTAPCDSRQRHTGVSRRRHSHSGEWNKSHCVVRLAPTPHSRARHTVSQQRGPFAPHTVDAVFLACRTHSAILPVTQPCNLALLSVTQSCHPALSVGNTGSVQSPKQGALCPPPSAGALPHARSYPRRPPPLPGAGANRYPADTPSTLHLPNHRGAAHAPFNPQSYFQVHTPFVPPSSHRYRVPPSPEIAPCCSHAILAHNASISLGRQVGHHLRKARMRARRPHAYDLFAVYSRKERTEPVAE